MFVDFANLGFRVVKSGQIEMQFCWPKFALLATLVAVPALGQKPTTPVGFGAAQLPPAAIAPTVPSAKADIATKSSAPPAAAKTAQSSKGRHNNKKKQVEKVPEPELPPPPPPTPEQLPPNPPQVSYLNGQLTIQSTNATMASIFTAIRQQTGAAIDLPAGAGNERVATRIGPGPANDVIASLLSGSSYDFVIVGNADVPGGVQRVLLTKQGTSGSGNNIAGMIQRPVTAPQTVADDNPDDESDVEPEPEQANTPPEGPVPVQQPQQMPGNVQPNGQPNSIAPAMPPTAIAPGDQQQQQQQGDQGNGGPQIKTPEQMLQELQRLQQQQQQQQRQ